MRLTVENSMEVPQETNKKKSIWSSNPTPEWEVDENSNLKRYMHLSIQSSTSYNSQDVEAAPPPPLPNRVLFSHKKE